MKNIKNLTSIIAFSIVTISIFILSCDFKGVTDDFEIQITNDILNQEALISVIDVVNPDLLEGTDKLKVEVLGPDADKFVTNSGEKISNLKVIDGNIALAVNPNFSSSEPLKVLLKISGNNYLTTTIPLVMFPEDTLVTKSINIVNKLNTVQGVDFLEDNKSLSNNTLSTNHIIKTSGIKSSTKTEINIESGTVFQDANGNAISGTSLKSEVVHFSTDTPESIASVPGGTTPLGVIDENGEESDDISFITEGFTSIDMFIGGKEVKKFSKPVSISVELADDLINFETGNKIAIGDQIPLWTYDENGQWSYHKMGTVTLNSDGKFNIIFTTTHLSWFRRSWRRTWFPSCANQVTIQSPPVPNLPESFYNLSFDLVYAHNDQIILSNSIDISRERYLTAFFTRIPSANLKVKFYYGEYSNKKLVYTSNEFNGCNFNTINLDTQAISKLINPEPQIKNIKIQFKAKCGTKILNPFLYLYRLESYTYYGRTYSYWRRVGFTINGKGNVKNVKIGVPQKYRVYFGGRSYEYDYTFNSDNIVIGDFQAPGDLCSRLF